jgi:hypothetical protein
LRRDASVPVVPSSGTGLIKRGAIGIRESSAWVEDHRRSARFLGPILLSLPNTSSMNALDCVANWFQGAADTVCPPGGPPFAHDV